MKLVKENIENINKYELNKKPYRIKLDANEGENIFFSDIGDELKLNLYPDGDSSLLRNEIGKYLNVDPNNIVAGNGSSEMIELVMKAFIDKGDIILSFIPTFSMYQIFSQIYSAKFIGINCNENFVQDVDVLIEEAKNIKPKIIFICNPNNPTGYLMNKYEIKKLLNNTDSLVVVDEAYIEFAQGSMVEYISQYENLIVLRTLSKAFGLAAIRVGYMVSNKHIINIINKVKSPYNLNSISQYIGVKALREKEKMFQYIEEVKKERNYLYNELKKFPIEVYPSNGNFIFFKSEIYKLDEKLNEKGILIRSFSKDLENHYRVTVGNRWENEEFIKSLKEILENENS
ncbi:MAG: histidinol-phosphate transaminase [Tissierellia bacterium]|nr:histidinol-phosphate transaminase [Tissierellia bacterium]